MLRRLIAVAVLSALIATGTNPSYCADMLRGSADATAASRADAFAVTGSHDHHHHADTDPVATPGPMNLTAGAAACLNCGALAVKAVTTDGRAKLIFTAEAAVVGSDPQVSQPRRPSAAADRSTHSRTPPLLIPLRI